VSFVVDTHPLLWHVAGAARRLSARARRAFADADSGAITLHVPTMVLYEIVLLEGLGKIEGAYAPFVEQLQLRPGYVIEPLALQDIDEARALAVIRDPFDRAIAATAVRVGLPLLTCDGFLTDLPALRTVW